MTAPFIWEQHCCLPLVPDADLRELRRYASPGGAYVSVNVGYAPHGADDVRALTRRWSAALAEVDGLVPVTTATALRDGAGVVTVGFDLEDSAPLEGSLQRVQDFYDLGVRTLLPTYNLANAAGGGCLDPEDRGLTAWGRALVQEMNRVGMVVDGSHCGRRTGLELSATSAAPMVYSHSCMQAVWDHPRNISDEQARACAETGGVVGITGVGIFLGPNDASVEAMLRHIEHAVDLVGPEHVGVSTDYPFDVDDFNREVFAHPELFPDSYTRWGPIEFVPPESLLLLADVLLSRGYGTGAVAAILGGNFARVAREVWTP